MTQTKPILAIIFLRLILLCDDIPTINALRQSVDLIYYRQAHPTPKLHHMDLPYSLVNIYSILGRDAYVTRFGNLIGTWLFYDQEGVPDEYNNIQVPCSARVQYVDGATISSGNLDFRMASLRHVGLWENPEGNSISLFPCASFTGDMKNFLTSSGGFQIQASSAIITGTSSWNVCYSSNYCKCVNASQVFGDSVPAMFYPSIEFASSITSVIELGIPCP